MDVAGTTRALGTAGLLLGAAAVGYAVPHAVDWTTGYLSHPDDGSTGGDGRRIVKAGAAFMFASTALGVGMLLGDRGSRLGPQAMGVMALGAILGTILIKPREE